MSSSYRLSLEKWLSELDVTAKRVIDVGGAQLPVKGRTRSWDVEEYLIYDLERPHANAPKPNYVIDIESMDVPNVPGEADVVFCLEVMDYIVQPFLALDSINTLLRPGGTAYVSFPFVYPIHQPVRAEGLRYTDTAIRRLATMLSMTVVQLVPRRPETRLLSAFYAAERMRAAKGVDHDVFGWIVELRKKT